MPFVAIMNNMKCKNEQRDLKGAHLPIVALTLNARGYE